MVSWLRAAEPSESRLEGEKEVLCVWKRGGVARRKIGSYEVEGELDETLGPLGVPFWGVPSRLEDSPARPQREDRRQAFARPFVGPPRYSPWFECSRLDSYVSIKTSSKLKSPCS